ncbi:hypothetical protein CRYUN_Cryun21dG0063100 [Craigia yunnanensis]
MGSAEEKRIEDELSYPILLADRVRSAADEAESFGVDCGEVEKQVDRLSQMLRTLVRFTTSAQSLYERPIRRVVSEVSKNLERALTLVRKCAQEHFAPSCENHERHRFSQGVKPSRRFHRRHEVAHGSP